MLGARGRYVWETWTYPAPAAWLEPLPRRPNPIFPFHAEPEQCAIPPQDDLQDRFLYQKAAEQCIRQSSPPYPAQASHTVVLQLWNRTGRGVRVKSAVSPRRFRPAHDRVNAGAHSSSSLHYFLIPLSGPIGLDPNNSTQRVSWTVSLRLEMPFSPMRPSMPVCLA